MHKYRYIDFMEDEKLVNDIFRGALLADIPQIERALEEDASAVNARHPFGGMSPVSVAASAGNYSAVGFLLSQPGVDTFQECDSGHNALFYAASSGHQGVIRLIEKHEISVLGLGDPSTWPLHDEDGDTPPPRGPKSVR